MMRPCVASETRITPGQTTVSQHHLTAAATACII